jgi:CAP12/Pycsar effector protein, TIR domain
MASQKSKQPLTDAECEVARFVVQRFVNSDETTSERLLMRELKPLRPRIPEAIRRLAGRSVFNTVNNTYGEETYTPKAIAFHYCGDADLLALAKKSTELILGVVRNLFERELDSDANDPNQKPFTRQDAEAEARKIDPTVTPEMVRIGLALAEEFSVFRTWGRNAQQFGVTTFLPSKHIFELDDNPWDKHIRQSAVWLERDAEGNSASESASFPVGWLAHDAIGLAAPEPDSRKVFLVHGHAEEPKQAVATFLRAIGLDVIILHEKANQGLTIIEKFEKHSGVGFAVVLLTPDDVGGPAGNPQNMSLRARQNVILELGYFLAKLGRNRVCCIYVKGVELPSDYDGVLYVPYDAGDFRAQLAKELIAAGIEVDSDNLKKVLSERAAETEHGSEVSKRKHKSVPDVKLDNATAESKANDPMAEKRWNRVRDEISKLPEYNREALRLLLEYASLTDYTALQKLGQLGRENSLASVLPGLQNQTGLIRRVPGQPSTRQPEYELSFEITPDLRSFVERYFNEKQ